MAAETSATPTSFFGHDPPDQIAAGRARRMREDEPAHAGGGRRMMTAAAEALQGFSSPPLLIGVTVLTSLSDADLAELGYAESAHQRVLLDLLELLVRQVGQRCAAGHPVRLFLLLAADLLEAREHRLDIELIADVTEFCVDVRRLGVCEPVDGDVHIAGDEVDGGDSTGGRRGEHDGADAGCDGVQVNFYDFLPDLAFFGDRVLPLMKQAGLRVG